MKTFSEPLLILELEPSGVSWYSKKIFWIYAGIWELREKDIKTHAHPPVSGKAVLFERAWFLEENTWSGETQRRCLSNQPNWLNQSWRQRSPPAQAQPHKSRLVLTYAGNQIPWRESKTVQCHVIKYFCSLADRREVLRLYLSYIILSLGELFFSRNPITCRNSIICIFFWGLKIKAQFSKMLWKKMPFNPFPCLWSFTWPMAVRVARDPGKTSCHCASIFKPLKMNREQAPKCNACHPIYNIHGWPCPTFTLINWLVWSFRLVFAIAVV